MEVANRQLDCADHFNFTTVMTDKNSTAMCYDGEGGLLLWSRFDAQCISFVRNQSQHLRIREY